jgi:hypothetical protein
MEDLWKLTRMDYRISAIAEPSAYEEIVRRYHAAEEGPLHVSATTDKDLLEMLNRTDLYIRND